MSNVNWRSVTKIGNGKVPNFVENKIIFIIK